MNLPSIINESPLTYDNHQVLYFGKEYDTERGLLGDHLVATWRPLGDCGASPAMHHLRCITCSASPAVYMSERKTSKERENCSIFTLDFIHIFVYERGGKPLKERENCFIFASNLINVWVRIFY